MTAYELLPEFVQDTPEWVERYLAKIDRSGDCWEWAASLRGKGGYGSFSSEGRTEYAHRIAYTLFVGPIPSGMMLDHLCRNRQCVRPDHLEPVTARENVRRGIRPAQAAAERKRYAAARETCSNGHPWEGNERIPKAGGRYCLTCRRELARRYRAERRAAK